VLPRIPADEPETTALPQVTPESPRREGPAAGGTPPVPDEAETRALPRAPENEAPDRTRELPQLDDSGRPRRPRPEWAEETPMDDLPTLADELLGPFEDTGDAGNAGDTGNAGDAGDNGRNRGKRR
ncbi:dTMP kinase, partial [Streptomyces sp. OF3]|nr:dTMP kinase [Streptomyces alkaliterrae]